MNTRRVRIRLALAHCCYVTFVRLCYLDINKTSMFPTIKQPLTHLHATLRHTSVAL